MAGPPLRSHASRSLPPIVDKIEHEMVEKIDAGSYFEDLCISRTS